MVNWKLSLLLLIFAGFFFLIKFFFLIQVLGGLEKLVNILLFTGGGRVVRIHWYQRSFHACLSEQQHRQCWRQAAAVGTEPR
jgi:ABC-type maltose transport system permease subunit